MELEKLIGFILAVILTSPVALITLIVMNRRDISYRLKNGLNLNLFRREVHVDANLLKAEALRHLLRYHIERKEAAEYMAEHYHKHLNISKQLMKQLNVTIMLSKRNSGDRVDVTDEIIGLIKAGYGRVDDDLLENGKTQELNDYINIRRKLQRSFDFKKWFFVK